MKIQVVLCLFSFACIWYVSHYYSSAMMFWLINIILHKYCSNDNIWNVSVIQESFGRLIDWKIINYIVSSIIINCLITLQIYTGMLMSIMLKSSGTVYLAHSHDPHPSLDPPIIVLRLQNYHNGTCIMWQP